MARVIVHREFGKVELRMSNQNEIVKLESAAFETRGRISVLTDSGVYSTDCASIVNVEVRL